MPAEPVTEKKAYPLRINAPVLDAMQRWSNDELRSLNAQIEYELREALRKTRRLKATNDIAAAGNAYRTTGRKEKVK